MVILKLVYFASIREKLGLDEERVEVPAEVVNVATLKVWLAQRGGIWQEVMQDDRKLLASVNQEMASDEYTVQLGDEIAFFPPVTGG